MKNLKLIITYIFVLSIVLGNRAYAYDLKGKVHELKLKNGMRWLLVERHQAPVFSGIVMVRVGGADEEQGKTGLAHMFEHMAFKGSSKLGTSDFSKEKPILDQIELTGEEITKQKLQADADKKKLTDLETKMQTLSKKAAQYQIKNEIWEIMSKNGGSEMNAFTSKDMTAYHSSMPINKLGLWMDITSQMVEDPVFREFYTEQKVVLEERRDSIENDPIGKIFEKLLKTAFSEGPYKWHVLGELNDIESFTISDARDFHNRYYIGSNMVGVLVGDFKTNDVEKLIKKYFEGFPKGDLSKNKSFFKSDGGGKVTIEFDAEPAVVLAYHKSTLPNSDEFVFDVMQVLLCDGPTSRLQKQLVYDERIATSVYCTDSYPGSRYDNLFLIFAEPAGSHTTDELSNKIKEAMDRLKKEIVPKDELDRVKNKVAASMVYALEENNELAMQLATFETVFDDWKLLVNYPKSIERVSPQDIKRVAKKYFNDELLTEVVREKRKGK